MATLVTEVGEVDVVGVDGDRLHLHLRLRPLPPPSSRPPPCSSMPRPRHSSWQELLGVAVLAPFERHAAVIQLWRPLRLRLWLDEAEMAARRLRHPSAGGRPRLVLDAQRRRGGAAGRAGVGWPVGG